jgi:hypothetical protein
LLADTRRLFADIRRSFADKRGLSANRRRFPAGEWRLQASGVRVHPDSGGVCVPAEELNNKDTKAQRKPVHPLCVFASSLLKLSWQWGFILFN